MSAYLSGYAFTKITIDELQAALSASQSGIELLPDSFTASDNNDNVAQVEIKELDCGIFLDTEFELKDSILIQLSKFIDGGILKFKYHDASMKFLCNYFLNGEMPVVLLERERILYDDKIAIESLAGMHTDAIISKLFLELTGVELMNSFDVDGEIYHFQRQPL